jgi:hypothetical protein
MARFGGAGCGEVLYGRVRSGLVWCGAAGIGLVRCGMARQGQVGFGVVRRGMVRWGEGISNREVASAVRRGRHKSRSGLVRV